MPVISYFLKSLNSSIFAVPFLNLMSNLEERAGGVAIRLGGNTQEYSSMVDSLLKGATFSKFAFTSNRIVSWLAISLESLFTILSTSRTDTDYLVYDWYISYNCQYFFDAKYFFGMIIPLHSNSLLGDLFFFNLRHPVQRSVDWRLTIVEKGKKS